MNSEQFEAFVHDVMRSLPAWVHEALENIQVLTPDEPDDYLDPDGDGLLGLYVGVPITERGADYAGELPDVIYVFRLPHLELGLPDDELREEIAKTLLHEIAHYFGMDDDHLDEMGWA